jgi:hypothetical protein
MLKYKEFMFLRYKKHKLLELEKKLLSSNFGFTQKAWEDQ